MSEDIYQKWRESEAYAVPMTEDGVKWSQERWRGFNAGYKQAVKDAVDLLMVQHEAAKSSHNYWHVAANLIKAELVHDSDTSQERVDFPDELRHIAEQAGFCHDINNGIYLCAPMHMEKFAELIVRECVRYFNEDYQRDFDTLWREDLTKGIKEHFGVKA